MRQIVYLEAALPQSRRGWKRRVRVLWRLFLRRLFRGEVVEKDSRGRPKPNPIRWHM